MQRTQKRYPSDISREQFEKIRPLLESARQRTKPRTVDLYDVFHAVLYLLKSGCLLSSLGMVALAFIALLLKSY